MLQLRIQEILDDKNRSVYWLWKQMNSLTYQNVMKIVRNETTSIKFENLERISRVLEVPVGELFFETPGDGPDYIVKEDK